MFDSIANLTLIKSSKPKVFNKFVKYFLSLEDADYDQRLASRCVVGHMARHLGIKQIFPTTSEGLFNFLIKIAEQIGLSAQVIEFIFDSRFGYEGFDKITKKQADEFLVAMKEGRVVRYHARVESSDRLLIVVNS